MGELHTPLAQAALRLYLEEIKPRIAQVEDDATASFIQGVLLGLEPQLPEFLQTFDRDPALQDAIAAQLERALKAHWEYREKAAKEPDA